MTVQGANPPSHAGQHRGRERRRNILSAAERLFADRGYARTSMKEIAGAVGVTDAALYKHFESKRDILEVLYEERGFFRAMDELEHLTGNLEFETQFRRNTAASTDLWEQNADFLRVIFTEAIVGDAMALDIHLSLMDRWRHGLERLFGIYAARGEVNPGDAPAFARMVVDLSFGAFIDRLLCLRGDGEAPAAFADAAFRERLEEQVALLANAFRAAERR